jgi:hypothetical protein
MLPGATASQLLAGDAAHVRFPLIYLPISSGYYLLSSQTGESTVRTLLVLKLARRA